MFDLKSKPTETKRQILINRDEDKLPKYLKLKGMNIPEAYQQLGFTDVDLITTETKEGNEITSLGLIFPKETIIVPFSKAFTADESWDSMDELGRGRFSAVAMKADNDPEDGPYTGPTYLSFGYPAELNIIRRKGIASDKVPAPQSVAPEPVTGP